MGLAVRLRVDDHAAELDDLEHTAALGDTVLFVEDRAAVLNLDEESHNEHEPAGDCQANETDEDVQNALEDAALKRETGVAAHEKRRVEEMDVLTGSDDDIRNLRHDVS